MAKKYKNTQGEPTNDQKTEEVAEIKDTDKSMPEVETETKENEVLDPATVDKALGVAVEEEYDGPYKVLEPEEVMESVDKELELKEKEDFTKALSFLAHNIEFIRNSLYNQFGSPHKPLSQCERESVHYIHNLAEEARKELETWKFKIQKTV